MKDLVIFVAFSVPFPGILLFKNPDFHQMFISVENCNLCYTMLIDSWRGGITLPFSMDSMDMTGFWRTFLLANLLLFAVRAEVRYQKTS